MASTRNTRQRLKDTTHAHRRDSIHHFKELILIILLITGVQADAGWLLSAQQAGFFGKYSVGVGYTKERHAIEILVGSYSNGGTEHYQGNLLYRYSRWNVPFKDVSWKPLLIGVFIIRSWDQDRYFLRSPSQYPEDNYYEPTQFRFGLEFGTMMVLNPYNLGVSYRLRILDSGIIALYNNSNKDLQYYTSSGFALQYFFD